MTERNKDEGGQLAELPALGVHVGMSNADYHTGPGISKSGLDRLAISPAHYFEARINPYHRTPALDMGTLFHAATLEPETVDKICVVKPDIDRRTKAGKAAWEEFIAEHGDKIVIPPDDWDTAHAMAESVHTHPIAGPLCSPDDPGPFEPSAFWIDPFTMRLCKTRPDKRNEGHDVLVDLKSALLGEAARDQFAREAAKRRYHVADAMMTEGWRRATKKAPQAVLFVVVEKVRPYAVAIYRMDREERELGEEEFRRDLELYDRCMELGEWPAYPPEIHTLRLPPWAFRSQYM